MPKRFMAAAVAAAISLFALSGCTNFYVDPNNPGVRAATGAAIGAGSGAVLGGAVGGWDGAALGAAVGGVVGAVTGAATAGGPPPAQ